VLQVNECTPTPSSSIVFTFGLAFESFKEFGGALLFTRCGELVPSPLNDIKVLIIFVMGEQKAWPLKCQILWWKENLL
jgi:hypothetical protein